jgi:hypothetical protein
MANISNAGPEGPVPQDKKPSSEAVPGFEGESHQEAEFTGQPKGTSQITPVESGVSLQTPTDQEKVKIPVEKSKKREIHEVPVEKIQEIESTINSVRQEKISYHELSEKRKGNMDVNTEQ